MAKKTWLLFVLLLLFHGLYAHLGSPGVIMEGKAGPYKILVSIAPPDVIPGIAKVRIYFQNGTVTSVMARAVYFHTGDEGSPDAELMKTVPGQPGQYTSDVWLMNSGSSSIQVSVKGSLGNGEMVVPVVAVSTAIKKMPRSTGWILSLLGLILFVLMVSIIGYSVSDALTKAGEELTPVRKTYRRAGIVAAIVLTSLVIYAGNSWWKSWIDTYNRFMYLPLKGKSTIRTTGGSNELLFALDTLSNRSSDFSFVVPDHGKLMHMFVVRIPMMDAFAHLHPQRLDSAHFRTLLPNLPQGKYLVFADIVYNTGFTETIKDTVNIPSASPETARMLDKDDGYAFAPPINQAVGTRMPEGEEVISCGKPGYGATLKDGSTMVWEGMTNEPFLAGQVYQLKFSVLDPDKKAALLQPYLGMPAHAAIIRNDGNVYIHLHPVGTFSMAAETNMLKRIAEPQGLFYYPDPAKFRDSIDHYIQYLSELDENKREELLMQQMNMPQSMPMDMGMEHSNMVEFPYSFPLPGNYRIWVQIKKDGKILTAAFDKVVK